MYVRLIDIVLIVLFGFISISTLQSQRKITLPKTTEVEIVGQDTLLVVSLTLDGSNVIYIDTATEPVTLDDARIYIMGRMEQLDDKVKVKIRAPRLSPFGHIRQVAALYDELDIPRSVVVQVAN